MGVLDQEWREEPQQKENKNYDDTTTAMNCDFCGNVFMGQAWMRNSKKKLSCRDCWKAEQDKE